MREYELHDWVFVAILALTWPVLLAIAGFVAVGWVALRVVALAARSARRWT